MIVYAIPVNQTRKPIILIKADRQERNLNIIKKDKRDEERKHCYIQVKDN